MSEASNTISTITHTGERRDPIAVWPDNASLESRSVLKACIGAHRALARLQQDRLYHRSHAVDRTLLTLNLIGAWQLGGVALNTADVLVDPQRHAPVGLLHLRDRLPAVGSELARNPIGRVLALELATLAANDQVCVRRCPPEESACQALSLQTGDFPVGAENLQRLLDDWESLVQYRSADLDPLVLLAMSHARYLSISAFSSMNIQSVCALDALLPVEEGLLDAPVLTLAWYLSRRADEYRHALHVLRAGDTQAWLQYLLHAIEQAATEQRHMLAGIAELRSVLRNDMVGYLPRQADPDALTDVCLQPSCTIADLVDSLEIKRHAAGACLSRLESAGVLAAVQGGRSRRYVNRRILQLLIDI